MWKMLQLESPQDFVLATGRTTTVREFVEIAFNAVNIPIEWKGHKDSIEEMGINPLTGKALVKVDPKYFRPSEVELLIGDPTKAKNILGWEAKTSVEELANIMVQFDLKYFESTLGNQHEARPQNPSAWL
jgi:GDPmannose 4,6-dehydratase